MSEIYCVDMGGGKSTCLVLEDLAPTLTTTHYGEPIVMMRKEPIVLESNQNHATITQNGICPTLSASMGLGGICTNDYY